MTRMDKFSEESIAINMKAMRLYKDLVGEKIELYDLVQIISIMLCNALKTSGFEPNEFMQNLTKLVLRDLDKMHLYEPVH